MSNSKAMLPKTSHDPTAGLLEQFSPLKFEKIPATNTQKTANCFQSYQPRKCEVLDYNISETFLQMEHIGTQIKYRETKAEYIPAPEEHIKKQQMKKKNAYSHGGLHRHSKFVDEIWLHKQEELQKVYKQEFKQFLKQRKNRDKCSNNYHHSVIQALCGPEWYQELSPKQIITVNTLQDCIAKDLNTRTIYFTKDAIAKLGLVCRPHHKKIEVALRYCSGCPIEFLFILYQLLDPQRTKYSLNDRLLLSAVVHLTMTHTLRELHVRIPSPVRKIKRSTSNAKKKQKKKMYASPYLVPYTFKPEPPKYSGIYHKKHIQFPESPYFVYLDFFKVEKSIAQDYAEFDTGILDEVEKDLVEETIQAQKLFNEIHNTEKLILLKPTIWASCSEFEKYEEKKLEKTFKIRLPSLQKLEISEYECVCQSNIEVDCNNEFSCEKCKNKTKIPIVSSFCAECKHKKINSIVAGIVIIGCNIVIPINGGIYLDTTCLCKEKLENQLIFLKTKEHLERTTPKYVVNGVVITPSGPVFILSSVIWNNRLKELLETASIVQHENEKTSRNELAECACSEQQSLQTKYFSSYRNHSIGENPMSSSSPEASPSEDCRCKKALDVFLNNKCTCERCIVEKRRETATYILTGTAEFENEPSSRIVQGVQDYQCSCLEKYVEKMKRVEEYRQRCQAAYDLRKKGIKYALGGVTYTEAGPIYQISGLRPPVHCVCGKALEEEAQLQEELRRQPKMPPTGRIKFGICGIKETSEENFYIIAQALESGKCDCEQLYEEFMTEHENCWEAYHYFLEHKDVENTEYLREYTFFADKEAEETTADDISDCFQPDIAAENQECEVLRTNEHASCECLGVKQIKHQNGTQCEFEQPVQHDVHQGKMSPSENEASCGCNISHGNKLQNSLKSSIEIDEERRCGCNINHDVSKLRNSLKSSKIVAPEGYQCECNRTDSLSLDPTYTINFNPPSATPLQEEPCFILDEPVESKQIKRFILLKEFPKDLSAQINILKEALASMAADGYPLAKLPDSYKLPHFKLWMELRTKKKWTQDDRKDYAYFSKIYWGHTSICYQPVPIPKVNFGKEVLKKLTWNSAERCRDLLEHQKYMFRRKIKQQIVNRAREFFPTVFSYEFPTKTFRKCYFAYLPDKEESEVFHVV